MKKGRRLVEKVLRSYGRLIVRKRLVEAESRDEEIAKILFDLFLKHWRMPGRWDDPYDVVKEAKKSAIADYEELYQDKYGEITDRAESLFEDMVADFLETGRA